MVTSSLAVGLAWRFMFNDKFGVINYVLSLLIDKYKIRNLFLVIAVIYNIGQLIYFKYTI